MNILTATRPWTFKWHLTEKDKMCTTFFNDVVKNNKKTTTTWSQNDVDPPFWIISWAQQTHPNHPFIPHKMWFSCKMNQNMFKIVLTSIFFFFPSLKIPKKNKIICRCFDARSGGSRWRESPAPPSLSNRLFPQKNHQHQEKTSGEKKEDDERDDSDGWSRKTTKKTAADE